MSNVDKTWHLSQTPDEVRVTEFELQLWRVFNGFIRWVEECERYVNDSTLTGQELSVLHIIRMKDRPKSINDVGRILNRSDNYNIQYTIRKLVKMGLIEKHEASPRHKKSATYRITQRGIENTDKFVNTRRKILIDIFIKDSNLTLEEMTKTIVRLKSIYDDAEQAAASSINLPQKSQETGENDVDKEPED